MNVIDVVSEDPFVPMAVLWVFAPLKSTNRTPFVHAQSPVVNTPTPFSGSAAYSTPKASLFSGVSSIYLLGSAMLYKLSMPTLTLLFWPELV